METWRRVFRESVAPLLTNAQLSALLDALVRDDPRLVQGHTTSPPAVLGDLRCERACFLGFPALAEGKTVGEVAKFFDDLCDGINEEDIMRSWYFLTWFDETPREIVRREMAAEIREVLARPSRDPFLTDRTHRAEGAPVIR